MTAVGNLSVANYAAYTQHIGLHVKFSSVSSASEVSEELNSGRKLIAAFNTHAMRDGEWPKNPSQLTLPEINKLLGKILVDTVKLNRQQIDWDAALYGKPRLSVRNIINGKKELKILLKKQIGTLQTLSPVNFLRVLTAINIKPESLEEFFRDNSTTQAKLQKLAPETGNRLNQTLSNILNREITLSDSQVADITDLIMKTNYSLYSLWFNVVRKMEPKVGSSE